MSNVNDLPLALDATDLNLKRQDAAANVVMNTRFYKKIRRNLRGHSKSMSPA